MPLLSEYARRKKLDFLAPLLRPGDSLLEVGSGSGWLGAELRRRGFGGYRCVDLKPPADWVGDIRDWRRLGIPEAAFDFVVAFEVVEHVPCAAEISALLKPDGRAFLTSPDPRWDWACAALERLGLSQRRTSPHDHLVDFRRLPHLAPVELRRVGLISQWGLFRKAGAA